MIEECNVDEILKQMKTIDNLKQLREQMGEGVLVSEYPEMGDIGGKLDSVIEKEEAKLQTAMDVCGNLDDELPDEPLIPDIELPDIEIPEPPELNLSEELPEV